jgi:hypothetical protein
VARKEASADPGACGTERQNRCKPAPIRNSTGGNHRRRPNGIHYSGNERHGRHHAAHVAARFPPLGNYDINAAVHGSLCVNRRTNRMQHEGPTCLGAWNKGRRVTPEEGDDANSFIETHRESLFLRKFQDQIDGEWPWGQGARFPDLPPHRLDVCTPKREHAKSASIADGGREGRSYSPGHGSLDDR